MNKRISPLLVWIVLASFVFDGFLPAFSQSNDALQALYNRYSHAYQEYSSAVSTGVSYDETQAKYEAYQQAYKDYEAALAKLKGETAQPSSSGQGSSVQVTFEEPSSGTSQASVLGSAATSASSGEKEGNWFTRTFTKVKEKIFGKKGVKEMPLWEKVLWSVGKALVPTFGVMIATALLAPLSPIAMVAGGIVVGAALGGLMTYAFEKRMNAKYRETPKEDAKIIRDSVVAGAVEAVMAPFNMATGGLFGMVGPTVGSAIYRVAMTQACLGFAGGVLSAGVGGVVKNIWAKNVFHYPEKIAAAEARIDQILANHVSSNTPLTEAEQKELDSLRSQIDEMKSESYTHEDFAKDVKRAALSSVISGFVGSVVSDRFYTYESGRWADKISVKVFGSVSQGKAISSLVSTLPVNFISGAAGATLEKSFIEQDIKALQEEQKKYNSGSGAYQYYSGAISQLQEKKNDISMAKAGLNSMLSNFSVRAAQLSVQALKYNLYDAPKERRAAIDDLYRAQNDDWKKASSLYDKYRELLQSPPNIKNYRNPVAYAKANAAYVAKVDAARKDWLNQCTLAQQNESLPANQTIKADLTTRFDKEVKLNRMLELGRLEGGKAHILAMKEVLRAENPDYAALSDHDLTKLACQAIRQSYVDKYVSSSSKVAKLDETIQKYKDFKNGKIELTEAEAELLKGREAMISPSQYKAALVEQKVYELKANGAKWAEIRGQMPQIYDQADSQVMKTYGGNWVTVLGNELLANGLAKYKYNPEGNVNFASEMTGILKKVPQMVQSGVVSNYKDQVNSAISSSLLPTTDDSLDFQNYAKIFATTAVTEGTGTVMDTVYKASKDRILSSFAQTR